MSRVAPASQGFLFTSYLLITLGLVSLTHATIKRKPSRAPTQPNLSAVFKAMGTKRKAGSISQGWLEPRLGVSAECRLQSLQVFKSLVGFVARLASKKSS